MARSPLLIPGILAMAVVLFGCFYTATEVWHYLFYTVLALFFGGLAVVEVQKSQRESE